MADRYGRWDRDRDERRGEGETWRESGRAREEMQYPGGGFGSEHRGYAHVQEPQETFGPQRRWGPGDGGYGRNRGGHPTEQGAFDAQERGYGQQGSHAYEGGPGYGLPGDYGSNRNGGPQPGQGGGYGPEGAGYGTQSSYAAHGGYGSPGERWQSGYGAPGGRRSQGYGTHAGYGSGGGYGPGGDAHWPQSSWVEQGRGKRRGPKGYTRSDERIREDLCERLMHSDYIDSSEVTVEVSGGKVTIDGTVPERHMKHAIEDMAEATSGVNEVENKVRVQQPTAQAAWAGSGATGSAGLAGSTSFGSGNASVKKE